MSLINQMLQELDARRSEATGTSTFGEQIRAVPERRGIHPAWWVTLVLAGVLAGVLAWLLLRPPVSVSQEANAQLPPKLEGNLNKAAQSAVNAVTQENAGDVTTTAVPVLANKPNQVVTPPLPTPTTTKAEPASVTVAAPPAMQEKQDAVEKTPVSVHTVKEAPPAPVSEVTKLVPPAKSLAKPAEKVHAFEAPVVINKQVKELTPQQRAENEYRKAILLLERGKVAEAIAGLELALQLDPKHTAVRHTLIGSLLENKRQDEAMRLAREGLGLDQAQPGLAMILARLQIEKGELHSSIETLERTLPYASDRADYQAFLAVLLQRDERHKQAAEHYLLALQKSPQNGVWWMGLGISLQAEHRTSEAREAFKRAKETNTLSSELLAFVNTKLNQLQR